MDLSSHDNAILHKIFTPNLPFSAIGDEERLQIDEEDTVQVEEAKSLEAEGVEAAEKREISKAIELFNRAVEIAPHRASCFNNRAQAFQLCGKTDDAIDDLNKALELSGNQGKVACQAFTQRGIINKFKGRDSEAMSDFKAAAELGGEFGKQQVIAMNPYAALCNQMMSQVMRKVKMGEL